MDRNNDPEGELRDDPEEETLKGEVGGEKAGIPGLGFIDDLLRGVERGNLTKLLNLFGDAKDHLIYAWVEFLFAIRSSLGVLEKGIDRRGGEGEAGRMADSFQALTGLVSLAIKYAERLAPPKEKDTKKRALLAIKDVLERERADAERRDEENRRATVGGLNTIIKVIDKEIQKTQPKKRERAKRVEKKEARIKKVSIE